MPPASSAPAGRRRRVLAAVLLAAVALGLRLAPIGHGLPVTEYVPDTHVVRGALGMASDRDLVPPVGRWTTYPYLLPYLLLPVYGVEYALGRATGAWAGAGEFGRRLLEEPARAHLPARVVVALLGALTVWAVFRAARAAGLVEGAWAAAWLVATGLLHVHFSVQERPWVPLVLFLALAAWPAALHAREGGRRALVASGALAGLAFATHQGGLVGLAIPGIAWAAALGARPVLRHVADGVLAVLAFGVVAVALGHPYLLVHGTTPEGAVAAAELETDLSIGGQAIRFGVSGRAAARLSRAFLGYDPVLVLLALAGLPVALRRRRLLPATGFAVGWGAFFLTNPNDHVRYLLPLSVLLALPAGLAAQRAWEGRRAWRPLVLLVLALPLVQATRLAWVLGREDTRAVAERALAGLPADAVVAVDVYGPALPEDRASLERLAGWRELGARERHRLALLEAGAPAPGGPGLAVVPLADLVEFDRRRNESRLRPRPAAALGEDPNAALAALGVTHVLLVDRDPGDGRPPMLVDPTPAPPGRSKLPPLAVAPEPEWAVDPSAGGATPREARLPTELSFALLDLWRVERPGPELRLHRFEG